MKCWLSDFLLCEVIFNYDVEIHISDMIRIKDLLKGKWTNRPGSEIEWEMPAKYKKDPWVVVAAFLSSEDS